MIREKVRLPLPAATACRSLQRPGSSSPSGGETFPRRGLALCQKTRGVKARRERGRGMVEIECETRAWLGLGEKRKESTRNGRLPSPAMTEHRPPVSQDGSGGRRSVVAANGVAAVSHKFRFGRRRNLQISIELLGNCFFSPVFPAR